MPAQKSKGSTQANPFSAGFTNNFDAAGSFAELADIGRANFEALAKASEIATEGYGACAKTAFDFARSAIEQNAEGARAVLTAKTVQDAVDVQNAWARAAFDSYVSQTGKLSEMTAKATSEAFAPLQARIDEAVAKAGQAAA